MHHARIYKPAKTAMQSGRALTRRWILDLEREKARFHESLMGWTGSQDTLHQIRLTFETAEDAVVHAKKNGWSYHVQTPRSPVFRPKSYADNFANDRIPL